MHNVYLGHCPLKIWFSKLCHMQTIEFGVSRVLERGNINLSFRRNFKNPDILEWEELEEIFRGVQHRNEQDAVTWGLTKHIGSLLLLLCMTIVPSLR
jgi:hypothetical protein